MAFLRHGPKKFSTPADLEAWIKGKPAAPPEELKEQARKAFSAPSSARRSLADDGPDGSAPEEEREALSQFHVSIPNFLSFPPELPPRFAQVESGAVGLEGFVTHIYKFKKPFSQPPHLLISPMGFLKFPIPLPTFSFKAVHIPLPFVNGIDFEIPIPAGISIMYLYLPTLVFIVGVEKDQFKVAHFLARSVCFYLAIGE